MTIKAFDNDNWQPETFYFIDPIDINSDSSYYDANNHDDKFYPQTTPFKNYSDDGRLDLLDEMDGSIYYFIRVVEIE